MIPITDRQIIAFANTLAPPLAGLTTKQLRTLHVIASADGPMLGPDLAQAIRSDPSACRRAVGPLVLRKLVAKTTDKTVNGCPSVLTLTEAGRDFHAHLLAFCVPSAVAA